MSAVPIPFRSNPSDFSIIGKPRIVNAYASLNGEDTRAPVSLVPTAGMKTFGSSVDGKCRGMIYVEGLSELLVGRGSSMYSVDSAGTSTNLGLIGGEDSIHFARNDATPSQMIAVTAGKIYTYEDGFFSYKVEDFSPAGVTFCRGRFIYWLADGTFIWTGINSTEVVSTLDRASAESDPDGLTSAFGLGDTLYLIGLDTLEVWGVTENADLPFQRVGGAHLDLGTRSPHTVKKFNNGLMMVGSDNAVYQLSGYQYQPVSSNEVSLLIEGESDPSSLVAFTHNRGANRFYVLQGTGWTREYNAATGEWSSREGLGGEPWHCQYSAHAFGKDIFGDRISGQLFEADYSIFTDDDENIPWGFDTSILHGSPDGLSFERVEIDIEAGDGISLSEAGEAILSWSDNNGRTWKGNRTINLGKTGEYWRRARVQRLGQCGAKGRIFRFRITDPVIRAVAGFDAMVERVQL